MVLLSRDLLRACSAAFVLLAATEVPQVPTGGSSYELNEPSSYGQGCFDGCACPVTSSSIKGTFRLVFVSADPRYTNYRVVDFDALTTSSRRFRGSGTYRIGGDFAVSQQMILDLTTTGESHRYDSGLVPGGAGFPSITIQLAANGFACFDSMLDIHAALAASDVEEGLVPGLSAAPPP